MEIPKVPKVFFIKGVFKHSAKSIEDVIQEQTATLPEDVTISYEPLLKIYNDCEDDKWLSQREVRCATCPTIIKGRHIFIPQSVECSKKALLFKCTDTARFCSWWCGAYHIRYFLNNDSRYKLLYNKLHEKWEHRQVVEIEPSIHPWRVVELGGDLTLDAFHKLNEFNYQRLQSSFEDQVDHESQ